MQIHKQIIQCHRLVLPLRPQEGQLSGRGDVFPAVFEEVPSVARFLTAAALVGEYAGKVVDETGYAVPMEHEWPAIYTFGGDDTARSFNGDLRRLELHGLAAEYVGIHSPFVSPSRPLPSPILSSFILSVFVPFCNRYASSPSASTASSPDDGSTSSGVFDPEAKRHERCDWRLYSNSTADRLWGANCMADSYAIFDSPTCTLRDILQRAWCTQEFQSISYL